jgi:hypothetical protein
VIDPLYSHGFKDLIAVTIFWVAVLRNPDLSEGISPPFSW